MRDFVSYYIGGGWGKEQEDEKHTEPAAVIRGTDIEDIRGCVFTSCPRRMHKRSNLKSRRLKPNDIVFEVSGGSKDQPVGRTLLVTSKILSGIGGDVICASFCKLVRPQFDAIDPVFLHYHLQSIYKTRVITQYQVQSTGISNFKFEPFLDEHTVAVPSLRTQRKIAAILSGYDDLIENNLRRIQILEEMAQNLYREWFLKLRFPGHNSVPMVDSPLGEIPKGWEATTLGDLVEQVRDGVSPGEVPGDTPYIGLEHLPRRSITLGEWGVAKDVGSTKLKFDVGDILFGKIRPYFHKVGIAPINGICSTDTIVMRPATEDARWVALGCTSSVEFVDHATATSQGTKMPRANWDVLAKYPAPLPERTLRTEFKNFMAGAVALMQNLMFRNHHYYVTRDLLLPKLISGELDVSDLDVAVPEEAA